MTKMKKEVKKEIKGEIIFCPECECEHEVKLVKQNTVCIIREEKIDYEEYFYYCELSEERFETISLINLNLLAAKNAYRKKHNLLTSEEIRKIREKYKITQEEFSILLGFGAKTIARYETKQIQDESNDNLMRLFDEDYNFALNQIIKQKEMFNETRYYELYAMMTGFIKLNMNEILEERALQNDYIYLENENDYNGNVKLDIDKIKNMMIYFANNTENLTKVKLMKLLWYCDALSYQIKHQAMTGLVYQHRDYGALPIGWDKIIDLNCVEKYEFVYNDHLCTQFLPKQHIQVDDNVFLNHELEILNKVCNKFKEISATNLSEIMHKEDVYVNSDDGEYLNFNNIKELKIVF